MGVSGQVGVQPILDRLQIGGGEGWTQWELFIQVLGILTMGKLINKDLISQQFFRNFLVILLPRKW